MRYGTRLGNCDDVTAADGPGQRNSGCRATVCCANACKRRITQQAGAGAAEWRIGHHRHAVLLAPRQQVMFNAAVADVVRDLIVAQRSPCEIWNRSSRSLTLKLDTPQARIFPAERRFSKAVTT